MQSSSGDGSTGLHRLSTVIDCGAMKLVSEIGRWATKDNSMIFSNVVYLVNEGDIKLYHLLDENMNEIPFDLDKCLKNGF